MQPNSEAPKQRHRPRAYLVLFVDHLSISQAVEVLQALGDQLELGQSLQIPPLVDPFGPHCRD